MRRTRPQEADEADLEPTESAAPEDPTEDEQQATAASTRPRRRRRLGPVLLGLSLLGLGAGSLTAAARAETGSALVIGRNAPVNPGATDSLDVTGNNSPEVAANPMDPANLVSVNRVDSPQFGCAMHVSLDGGAHWVATPIPVPDAKTVACFAPDLAFAVDGTLYVAYTTFAPVEGHGNVPDAVWLVISTDGGRTLSAPQPALGALAFHVRLVADPADASRLYLTWLQATTAGSWGLTTGGNPVMVARSEDAGTTWAEPVEASAPDRDLVVAPSLTIGRGGRVHLTYLDVGDDRLDYTGAHEAKGGDAYDGVWTLVAAGSDDHGASWTEVTVDRRLVPIRRFVMLFPPVPSIIADPSSENLYIAFHDARLGDADVWLWRSSNGGRAWSEPRRVNDTRQRDDTSQYLPQVAVGGNGRVDVVYYDRRADSDDVMNEVSLQASFDGGNSFTPRARLSDAAFDSRIGYGADRDLPDLGNRLGLVSTDPAALAVWADTRSHIELSGKQDLASALAVFEAPSQLRRPLQVLALLLLAAGIVTLLLGLRRGRGPSREPALDEATT